MQCCTIIAHHAWGPRKAGVACVASCLQVAQLASIELRSEGTDNRCRHLPNASSAQVSCWFQAAACDSCILRLISVPPCRLPLRSCPAAASGSRRSLRRRGSRAARGRKGGAPAAAPCCCRLQAARTPRLQVGGRQWVRRRMGWLTNGRLVARVWHASSEFSWPPLACRLPAAVWPEDRRAAASLHMLRVTLIGIQCSDLSPTCRLPAAVWAEDRLAAGAAGAERPARPAAGHSPVLHRAAALPQVCCCCAGWVLAKATTEGLAAVAWK